MSTKFESKNTSLIGSGLLLATLLAFLVPDISQAAEDAATGNPGEQGRSSVTRHLIKGGRDNPSVWRETTEDYAVLKTTGKRSRANTRAGFAKPGAGSSAARSTSFDFWIYDADVQLFNDVDNDGFFHGIDLLFDADTIFDVADVYAVLYLSFAGGPWNEYAVTEDFTIFGSSSTDEYVLVTELMSGYPSGSYDLLIELFDAFDGTFVASFGPAESSALGFLPLEDFNLDAPVAKVQIAISHGGGGSIDGWLLSVLVLILLVGAGRKIWRHRNDAPARIDSPAPVWRKSAESHRQNPG